MRKGLMFHHQQELQEQQQPLTVEENMSNLTSASGEASVSSGNRMEIGTSYPPQPQQYLPPLPKKKRNFPGNPDPDAEVIAMSPKSLLATNRFICEICNKGFQRDQNLQLHRRGHNLPWKLKQRTSKEVRKKVYVCPEPSCVHHDPSRALGDLTGIKKHFCRKHGEKKWKCDKCSKRYAVQSDWKAHSKTCGTREYKCDCGTLFSRRDSFITHRAFCDALTEESARANITGTNNNSSQQHPSPISHHHHHHQINLQPHFNIISQQQDLHANIFPLKKEHQQISFNKMPPWLVPPPMTINDLSSSIFSSPRMNQQEFSQTTHQNQNPNPSLVLPSNYQPQAPSPHMSATALLQKAAQMGASMSRSGSSPTVIDRPHHHQQQQQQVHVPADSSANNTLGLNLSSRDQNQIMNTTAATTGGGVTPSLLHDVINSFSSNSGFEGSHFEDAFGGILMNSKNNKDFQNLHDSTLSETTTATTCLGGGAADDGGGSGGGNEGLTRDFLGLRPLSHSDILSIAGIGNCMNDEQNESQKPWQG